MTLMRNFIRYGKSFN